ncbi:MAG: hypothetical protein AAF192_22145 [Pseudomonadota bacterium]
MSGVAATALPRQPSSTPMFGAPASPRATPVASRHTFPVGKPGPPKEIAMPQVDTLPTNRPEAVEHDDANLYRILKAIGVAFAVLIPVALLALPDVGFVARIWIAFLSANLLVWTGVVAVAVVQAVISGVAAVKANTAEPTPEDAPAAELAPAA